MTHVSLRDEPIGFIGRSTELAAARALLEAGARLVTVLGPGGVGKTRLCRRLAASLLEAGAPFADVVFCDLTEAQGKDGVVAAMAEALGASLAGAPSLEAAAREVGKALAARGATLVLADNFEQVHAHAGETVGVWLEAAPESAFLVTSRVPLDLSEERRYELGPLRPADARALFLERAQGARPRLAEGEQAERLLASVLERLDRLPLAIELAAPRLEVLSLAQLDERLSDSLKLLRRPGGGSGRHAALAAALEGSWQLLEPAEKTALAEAAVFAGGFTLEAAEAVLGGALGDEDVLDVLHALKRKSLLSVAPPERETEALRFRLLETVRAFALEKLEKLKEQGALEDAFARHARHFVTAAEAFGGHTLEAYARLHPEAQNLGAAHERMLDRDPALAARAALELDALLSMRGSVQARVRSLEAAVRCAEAARDARLLARARIALSEAARVQGRFEVAADEAGAALAVAEREGDALLVGAALSARGTAHVFRGDYPRGREDYERALCSLDAGQGRHAARARGVVLMRLFGTCIVEGRFAEGEPLGREALALLGAAGDARSSAITLANLGVLCGELGRHEEAAAFYEQARVTYAALEDRRSAAILLANRGLLALDEGALEEALALFDEVRERAAALQDEGLETCVTGFGGIALARLGRLAEARDRLEEARRSAERREDLVHQTLFLAWRAGIDALLSRPHAARRARDEARRLLPGLGNDLMQQAASFAAHAADLFLDEGAPPDPGAPGEDAPRGIHARIAHAWLERARGAPPPAGKSAPRAPARAEEPGRADAIVVTEGGMTLRVGQGPPLDLSRRGPMRRVLTELVEARLAAPGRALDAHALLDAGWPGQNVLPEAGVNRVYAAIKALRKLGLEAALVTRDDGYLISPDVEVRVEPR